MICTLNLNRNKYKHTYICTKRIFFKIFSHFHYNKCHGNLPTQHGILEACHFKLPKLRSGVFWLLLLVSLSVFSAVKMLEGNAELA